MSEYVILLQRAWQIIMRHKVLLVFGLIAVIAGQDAIFNLRGVIRLPPLAEAVVNLPLPVANALRDLFPQANGTVMVAVMIGVGLIWLAIGLIGHAAVIALTQAIERGDDATLKAGFQLALKSLPTLLVIRLIFNVPIVLLSIAGFLVANGLFDPVGGPLGYTAILQAAGYLPIFLIVGAMVGVFIGAIGVGADRACVLDGLGALAALKRGWHVFRKHLDRYVGVTGVFVSSGLLIVFTLACPIAILLADAIGALVQSLPVGADLTPVLLGTPLGAVIGVVLLVLYAGFTAFASVVWTLVYRRFE